MIRLARKALRRLLRALPLALALACTEPRHPGRDACYLDAEAEAIRRGVTECHGYGSTDECPAWPAIEADLKAAQEACP